MLAYASSLNMLPSRPQPQPLPLPLPLPLLVSAMGQHASS